MSTLSDLRYAFFGEPADELAALLEAEEGGFTFAELVSGGTLGQVLTKTEAVAAVNAVFHINASATGATGGTWYLQYGDQQTTALAYNANATAIGNALKALSNIGNTDVTVTGGPISTTQIVVTFQNALGGQPITGFIGNGELLTGPGSPYTVGVVNSTPGVSQVIASNWADTGTSEGLTLESPDHTMYQVTVGNDGSLSTTVVP